MKNLKLTSKLMMSIGGVVLFSFIMTVGIITYKSGKIAKTEARSKMLTLSGEYGLKIKLILDEAFITARTLSNGMASMKTEGKMSTREEILAQLKGVMKSKSDFLGVWAVWEPEIMDGKDAFYKGKPGNDKDGRFVPYWNIVGGLHLENCTGFDSPYYANPKKLRNEFITEPTAYVAGGKTVVMLSACVPIIAEDKFLGVAGIDFSMAQISEIADKLKPYGNGYAGIVTAAGFIGAHPDKKLIGKSFRNRYPESVYKAVVKGQPVVAEFKSKTLGEDAILAIKPFEVGTTGTNGNLVVVAPASKILEGARQTRNITIITAVIFIIILAVLVYFLTQILVVNPVKRVILRMEDISQGEGDLTHRLEITNNDELGILSKVFNEFIEKLQVMIKDISENVKILAGSSVQLSSISHEMSVKTIETSDKSSAVAVAAEEMTANMNSVAGAMEQTAANTDTVASAAEEMTATINEIASNTEEARSISQDAVHKVAKSSDKMNELGKAAESIGNVVETITDISEQVNLLSLNATIEAARAGEAGKGFAVVANEIKDLAGQTSKASMDIKGNIDNIQVSVSETLGQIKEISQVITDINENTSTIATAIEEQSATTKEISGNVVQVSNGIGDANQNISHSFTVAGEITRDITEVNQSAADMAEQSNEVQNRSKELSSLAEKLNNLVSRFKI